MTEAELFWAGSAFQPRWADSRGQRMPATATATAADIKPFTQQVDPLVASFWQLYGWGQMAGGFLVLEPPATLVARYAAWPMPIEAVPLLRTAWGHLLLMRGSSSWLLDPLYGGIHDMGCDAVNVLDALLVSPSFLNDTLLLDIYTAATERIGRTPGPGEVACFVPALALGGERHERQVELRAMSVTLDLLAQL
jgi:hypothetical protein